MSMSEEGGADRGGGERRVLAARLGPDMGLRFVSGLVLAVAVAICIYAGMMPFAVLVVLVAMLLGWEWGRLVHGRDAEVVRAVTIVTAGGAGVLAALGYVGLGLLALAIGAILAIVLSLGNNGVYSGVGVLYAGLPAIAMIWLRSDHSRGLMAVAFLIVVIVISDTAAFVCGRLLGGPRLWPRVSPNKTWAGLIGALVASSLMGALFWFLVRDAAPLRLAAVAGGLALVAQAGDLAESALKRRFGAKDSSALIPGHGGVMDRVDGLVAAASVAGLFSMAVNVHWPARALLLGF
jgi:phosphatidate cytidylyltransferase